MSLAFGFVCHRTAVLTGTFAVLGRRWPQLLSTIIPCRVLFLLLQTLVFEVIVAVVVAIFVDGIERLLRDERGDVLVALLCCSGYVRLSRLADGWHDGRWEV